MPFISIIIPVKNGKSLLQECIESVLSQTFSDYEIIVLTDSTTNNDGTLDYLKSLKLNNLRIEESAHQIGIQQNWERILYTSKCEFFTILGYDDILYRDYLATIADLIQNYPDATLYQTHFDYIDQTGATIKSSPQMQEKLSGDEYLERVLRSEYPVMATGFVMRSNDYTKVGGIPVKYPNLLYADFELWLRLTFLHYQAISPRKCFAFRIHQSTTKVSSTKTTIDGFSHFISYLKSLQSNPKLASVIEKNSSYFLKFHCNGIAYKIVRGKRTNQDMSVDDVIKIFERFASVLNIKGLELRKVASIKIAWYIDKFSFSRSLYLWIKKVYPKPIIKSHFD